MRIRMIALAALPSLQTLKHLIMAKKHFLARQASRFEAMRRLGEEVINQQDRSFFKGECVIQVLILCQDLSTAKRAQQLIRRDLGSQLIQFAVHDTTVGASFRGLSCFSPSEIIGFYHYHLQRALGIHARVWITTKGEQL